MSERCEVIDNYNLGRDKVHRPAELLADVVDQNSGKRPSPRATTVSNDGEGSFSGLLP